MESRSSKENSQTKPKSRKRTKTKKKSKETSPQHLAPIPSEHIRDRVKELSRKRRV